MAKETKAGQDQARARALVVELVAGLTRSDLTNATQKTSIRLPKQINHAIKAAVDAGWYESTSQFYRVVAREELLRRAEADQDRETLRVHYRRHPEDDPGLIEVVLATAWQEDHPAAGRRDLVERAVAELGPDADVDVVLAWTAGALAA